VTERTSPSAHQYKPSLHRQETEPDQSLTGIRPGPNDTPYRKGHSATLGNSANRLKAFPSLPAWVSSQAPYTMSRSPLSNLVSLLSSSVQTLEAAYDKAGATFPSLDAPFVPGALDGNPEVNHVARIIVATAAQIIATVRSPTEVLGEYSTGSLASAALSLTVDVHVANIIKDSGDNVRSVASSRLLHGLQDNLGFVH
jgi:hypothetical protein